MFIHLGIHDLSEEEAKELEERRKAHALFIQQLNERSAKREQQIKERDRKRKEYNKRRYQLAKANSPIKELTDNARLGIIGENIAANYVIEQGFRILHRNWKGHPTCELDIVAYKDNALHLIEVKTRSKASEYSPLSAIDKTKMRNIIRAGYSYNKFYRMNLDIYVHGIGIIYRGEKDYDIEMQYNIHEWFR